MHAMYKRFLVLFLGVAGLALLAAAPAPSAEGDNALSDELTVKSAGLPVDGPGLIEFFRLRTKAEPALLKALEDEAPLRRSTAIDVLCSNGNAEPRATLRKLLADPTPTVRLRAALALAQARDAKAVSTLIALLGELPVTQGRFA